MKLKKYYKRGGKRNVSKTKRSLSVLLAALILILSVSIVNVFAATTGDVNGDGNVTVSDAMVVFNYISGKEELTEEEQKKADVNKDGNINVADAMKIYNIILGKDTDEKKEGKFVITTYGWGHDIGMSQNGANLYAKNDGVDCAWILDHYYPGTTIVEKDDNAPSKVKYGGKEYSMRDYLAGALYAEMGPSFHKEALKAQCVAIYTYGKYHSNFGINFVANDHALKTDVKNAAKNDVIYDVVDEVMGQYLTYEGKVALTVYSATSAGTTAKCSDIWVQDLPYLTRVESKYDSTVSGYKKTVTYTEEEMKYKLENIFGVTLSSDPESWIQIISHDKAIDENIGHALSVSIDGQKTIKGARLYEKFGLRSPCYTVEYI